MDEKTKKIANAYVYQHLLTINKELAAQFKKENNAATLADNTVPFTDILKDYMNPKKKKRKQIKLEQNVVTEVNEEDDGFVIKQSKSFTEGVDNKRDTKFNAWGNKSFGGEKARNPYQKMGAPRPNQPFRRVDDSKIQVDERFKSNAFTARKNSKGDWAEKSYYDLQGTQGKGFKHAKTKKKRATFFGGGRIDKFAVNSVKFDD